MGGVRLVALWILLVAVYAATLGIPAQTGTDYAGNEPHHLLAAESIVSDRDVDLADEYRERSYASWYPQELRTDGRMVAGRLMEPHGVGFALLIAPAYAVGGARAVQGEMLALLALAFVLGAALARRMVPEPWATAGAALVGLSPPALAASTTITPGVPAAVLLSGAALCALAVRERPRLRYVFGGALLLALLPWLGWTFVAPGAVVGWALVGWTLRERRRLAALIAGEALVGSLVFYATSTTASTAASRRARPAPPRRPTCSAMSSGCRGSPVCGWTARPGCCAGRRCSRSCSSPAGCCYRSRRDQLARVAPARREAEACAALLLGVVGVQMVVVAILAGGGLRGAMFPGLPLVTILPIAAALTAWSLRHVPRLVAAVLALMTLGRARGCSCSIAATSCRAGSSSTPTRHGVRWSSCSRTSPARHCTRHCVCGDRGGRGGAVVARAACRRRMAAGGSGVAHVARAAVSRAPCRGRRTAPVRGGGSAH